MKIIFAIKTLYEAKGGAERVLADISAVLAERGHDIGLMTNDNIYAAESFYPLHPGIQRISIGIGNVEVRATIKDTIFRIMAFRKEMLQAKPDAVVAFMHSSFIPMSFALIGTGIPVIASEHIVINHYRTRPIEFLLLCFSSFFVRYITVLSEAIKVQYPKFLQKKMVVISNPVMHPPVDDCKYVKDAHKKRILNIGRLDPQKGQDILIEAFALLARDYPEWTTEIYGNGELKDYLAVLINKLEMQDRIFLKGTTAQISDVYRQGNIFALPSHYESFGLATAEAMAHGLPVVGFADCPGTNELIEDGVSGILVHSNNKDRILPFKAALDKLMNDSDLRDVIGKSATQKVKRFDRQKIGTQWENLIRSVLKK